MILCLAFYSAFLDCKWNAATEVVDSLKTILCLLVISMNARTALSLIIVEDDGILEWWIEFLNKHVHHVCSHCLRKWSKMPKWSQACTRMKFTIGRPFIQYEVNLLSGAGSTHLWWIPSHTCLCRSLVLIWKCRDSSFGSPTVDLPRL